MLDPVFDWAAAVYELTPTGEPWNVAHHPQPALAEGDYLLRCLSVRQRGHVCLVPSPAYRHLLWPGMFDTSAPDDPTLARREAHPGRRATWLAVEGTRVPEPPLWQPPPVAMVQGLLGVLMIQDHVDSLMGEIAAELNLPLHRLAALLNGDVTLTQSEDTLLRARLVMRWREHLDGRDPIRPRAYAEEAAS